MKPPTARTALNHIRSYQRTATFLAAFAIAMTLATVFALARPDVAQRVVRGSLSSVGTRIFAGGTASKASPNAIALNPQPSAPLAAFTPGNLVIYRVGDGSTALSTAAFPGFLDEYSTAGGSAVQSIALPTTAAGSNRRITAAGSQAEGFMNRSVDGQYLTVGGYDAAAGTAAVAGTTSAATNRVIARVNSSGSIDTTTALTDAVSAGNIRGVISTNGTDMWLEGSTGGSRYCTFGATTSTQLNSTAPTNLRALGVVGGQLYVSSSSTTFLGVSTVGSGTPTTTGQTITPLPGFPTTGSHSNYQFAFANSATIYVADDGLFSAGGGIQKWTLSGGTWSLAYTLLNTGAATTAVRGLIVDSSGANNVIYALTSATPTVLIKVTDTGAGATATTLATAAANMAFRGVTFAPEILSVSSTSPTDTATNVATNSNISVTFNTAVDTSTINTQAITGACVGTIQVSGDNFTTCIGIGSTVASGGNTIFTLTPSAALSNSTTYKIRVTTNVKTATGSPLSPAFTLTNGFTTVGPKYRSRQSGDWNDFNTWQVDAGSGFVNAIGGQTPTSASDTIQIQGTHTVTVTASVNADQLTVDAAGGLAISSGQTLTIDDGAGTDLTVNGILNINDPGLISGAGSFSLNAGATLGIGSPNGITTAGASGSIQVSGTRTFDAGANYNYIGGGAQVTGNGLPASLGGTLLIANSGAGVTLSQPTSVGVLSLFNGGFAIAGNLTINSGGTITRSNGSLSGTPTFSGLVNLTYNGVTPVTTGPEMPASSTALSVLTVNNTGGVTLGANATANAASSIGAASSLSTSTFTLAVGGTLSNSGAFNVNGAFQLNQGGFGNGNNFVYGAGATLIFNNSAGSFAVNGTPAYWPAANGPANVTVQGAGGITMSVARSVSGNFIYAAGVSGAANLTLNGTSQVNNGGFTSGSPTYGAAALLKYNVNASYGRNGEWLPNVTSGAGYPKNVQLSNNTNLDLANGSSSAFFEMSANLTIDAGSTMNLNGSPAMTMPLRVLGSVTNNGSLTLSSVPSGDLNVGGSFANNGTYTNNSRTLKFNGALAQTWSNTTGGQNFGAVSINNTSGGVSLTSPINCTTIVLGSNLTTTATNLLTVTSTNTNAVIGNASGFVNGPLARTLPASLTAPNVYSFPIGKSGFNPLDLVDATSNGGGTVVIKAEVFDANSGGTSGSGMGPLKTNRYWSTSITSGAANFNNTTVRLFDTVVSGDRIGQSATQSGAYNSIGGTFGGGFLVSNAINSLSFFNIGSAPAAADYAITTTGNAIVITDNSGNSDPLGMTEPAVGQVSFNVAGRTFSVDGGGPTSNNSGSIPLAGINSITVNQNAGNDQFLPSTFTGQLPSLTVNGGTGNDNVQFGGTLAFVADANLNVDLQDDDPTPGTDTVTFTAAGKVHLSGTGSATIRVSQSVSANPGSQLDVVNGDLTIETNQQAIPTPGNFRGVNLSGMALTTTGTGKISLLGKGGSDAATANHFGLGLLGGATISSTSAAVGAGTITLNGTGGGGTNLNCGVQIQNPGTVITSVTGNISITGHGGAGTAVQNFGVQLTNAAAVTSTGSAKITFDGTGGPSGTNSNTGTRIVLDDTKVTSSGGDITITGHGGTSTSPSLGNNIGVSIAFGALISGTNGARIKIDGTGGSGFNFNTGAVISNPGSQAIPVPTMITSDSGDIQITGLAGNSPDIAAIGINFGVGAQVLATGSANIVFNGTGGSCASDGYGVGFEAGGIPGSTVSAVNGNIDITGVATSATGPDQDGVRFEDSATPATDIVTLTTGTGSLTVTGTAGNNDPTSSGINFVSYTTLTLNGASNTFIADTMDISNTNVSINAGANSLTLRQKTNGKAIDLGGADSATQLGLTDAELDLITAGTLNLGDANSGAITISAPITRSSPTILNLFSAANIDFTTGSLKSGGGSVNLNPGTNSFPATSGIDADLTSGPPPRPNSAAPSASDAVIALKIASGRALKIVINGLTVDSGYTQLAVLGQVDISGVNLSLSGTHVPVIGQTFTIVDNDGGEPIIGTFAGLGEGVTIPNFLGSGLGAKISYVGGTGNDVVLTVVAAPTASFVRISGQIFDSSGQPVSGATVTVSGGANLVRAITDANGFYHVEGLGAGGFYTVSPGRANFIFTPASRAFSLLANRTDVVFTGFAITPDANPLATPEFFVRQQYLDFLNREPEQAGLDYWSAQLRGCAADLNCLKAQKLVVSAEFFMSQEFQLTGNYIYRLYRAGLGRPLTYAEFTSDRQHVVGGADLEAGRTQFAADFVTRPEFLAKYADTVMAETFVDALLHSVLTDTQLDLTSQREALIATYNSHADLNQSRSAVLRAVAETSEFKTKAYNPSFVLMEYFGYLRRDAENDGYDFWVKVLNSTPGNYRGMVCSFMTSMEYQQRFSPVIASSNAECTGR